MSRRNPESDKQGDLLGVRAGEWVVITAVCVPVSGGRRVEVVLKPGTGAPVEPGEVEDRGGEKPEVDSSLAVMVICSETTMWVEVSLGLDGEGLALYVLCKEGVENDGVDASVEVV